MPFVVPPVVPGVIEGLVFDGLDLNPASGLPWAMTAFSNPSPAKRPEWAQSGDTDGAALIRDPLVDNRTMTVSLWLASASMDAALAQLATLTAKIEEAEAQADNGGLPIVWTPANGTPAVTYYVLSGGWTDFPITMEAGYFANAPQVTFELTCKPYGYGDEVQVATVTSTAALIALEHPPIDGDVPAEARLDVTDAASQSRRYLAWGYESRDYNAATDLRLDLASGLTLTGFAGSSTTRSGSVATNVAAVTPLTQAMAVVGTTAQSHVGTFRVSARVFTSTAGAELRFSSRCGGGSFTPSPWVSPPVIGFSDVELGLVTIPRALTGTQQWTGQIEVRSATSGVTFQVDSLYLMPASLYGKARSTYAYVPPVFSSYDIFDPLNTDTGLNGQTADAGGAWATSGVATDFAGRATRVTNTVETSPRFAVLGTATFTDTEATILTGASVIPTSSTTDKVSGALARWVDSSNYAWAEVVWGTPTVFAMGVNVAGASTTLSYATLYNVPSIVAIRLLCLESGLIHGYLLDAAGNTIPMNGLMEYLGASDSSLATGGALASGKVGFFDQSYGTMTLTRTYYAFSAGVAGAEPVVMFANRALEVRSDDTLRQDSSGAMYAQPSLYRGSRLLLQPGGDAGRKGRVAVKARRLDVETRNDAGVADSTTVTLYARPRFLNAPH